MTLELLHMLSSVRAALEGAADRCRFHGDVRDPGGTCESCVHPHQVRVALAELREYLGRDQVGRLYVVDATANPHRVSGLFPVSGVRGLWAPADADRAREVVLAELLERGERGPFGDNVIVAVAGEQATTAV